MIWKENKKIRNGVRVTKGFYIRSGKKGCKKLIFEIIDRKKGKVPIDFMCCYLKVSRSGYYKWYKRRYEEDKDYKIAKLVEECERENNFCYGCRRG